MRALDFRLLLLLSLCLGVVASGCYRASRPSDAYPETCGRACGYQGYGYYADPGYANPGYPNPAYSYRPPAAPSSPAQACYSSGYRASGP